MKLEIGIGLLLLLNTSAVAFAAQCKSVGGHINGTPTVATRQANLKGNTLRLSGRMDGKAMPVRTLKCTPLAAGVVCEQTYGPVGITVMTRGKQMVETVIDLASGQETAGFSYQCDRAP